MKKLLLVTIVFVSALVVVGSPVSAGKNSWACSERAPDGQCIVKVSIGNSFPAIDKQVIREVLADFSRSPNVEVIEGKKADATIVQGCYKGRCGFLTDMGARKTYIDKLWSYANYCCNAHDGMRGVYCHELMHSVAGEVDGVRREQPSCFNGTSPFLGPEDFATIAGTYPLP